MKYLYAAYAVTWVIHIAYLIFLSRKAAKLRDEIRDLNR